MTNKLYFLKDYENRHSKNNRVSVDPSQFVKASVENNAKSTSVAAPTTTAAVGNKGSDTNSVSSATPTRESVDSPAIT